MRINNINRLRELATVEFLNSSQKSPLHSSAPEKPPVPEKPSNMLLWEEQQQQLKTLQAQLKDKEQQSQNLSLKHKTLQQQHKEALKTIFSLKTQKQGFLKQITDYGSSYSYLGY